ncbi:hypothetical protein [Pseudoflavonifractor sp. MSJ-37]|uniref:hypothetical protein n=1 Tax=Pseudoflavonifractor sp. MSJ-37 TaxID=2841531 RepID=UPI001C1198F2|nr:hypothetical protein [Pseudoflavonifractor sp. MSJ-37]MBU5435947.1 hypothetical protein [Pseudoflavonifractor sp. MSJ-37]
MALLMLLTACSSGGSASETVTPTVLPTSTNVVEAKDDHVEEARALIQKAFSYDASGLEPVVEEDQASFRFEAGEKDYYIVEFHNGYQYPATLYHFEHLGEDQDFDLAQEDDSYFDEGLIETAKTFVKDIYGVDCTEATVHAYGYKNKIAVQMETAPDEVFSVRYYYKDTEPTGVLFCKDVKALEQVMEKNEAKQYL